MQTMSKKDFIYNGFGFPVKLINVPFVKVRGESVPKFNHEDVARVLFYSLALKKVRLTGNEIKFIRQYNNMTLQTFADEFNVTHPGVLKWEKKGDKCTDMNLSTEHAIRLFILSKLNISDFWPLYKEISEIKKKSVKYKVTNVDVKKRDLVLA